MVATTTTWEEEEEEEMSRLSFRPRPLDIHKKLPIVKSVKDFEDDDVPTTTTTTSSTRNLHLFRLASDIPDTTEVFFLISTWLRHFIEHFACVMLQFMTGVWIVVVEWEGCDKMAGLVEFLRLHCCVFVYAYVTYQKCYKIWILNYWCLSGWVS